MQVVYSVIQLLIYSFANQQIKHLSSFAQCGLLPVSALLMLYYPVLLRA